MGKAVKYTFDTHFGTPAAGQPRDDTRSRKSYSHDEIEALTREARDEGRRDGDVRAAQALAASLAQIAAAVLAVIDAMDRDVERIRAEAAALAYAAARKLAKASIAAAPEEELAEALRLAFQQAVDEPRLVVRTAPGLAGKLQERAPSLALQEGYEGRIQFLADGGLVGADCRIEWRGGGIERAQASIESALADLIARRFPSVLAEEKE
jgi:flagellar assembly protein FliH